MLKATILDVISKSIKKWLVIENDLWIFKVDIDNQWQWWTSIVRGLSFINWSTQLDNKLVVKFLLEDLSNWESSKFKRFKQAYINLLLLKDNSYIIPQFYFWIHKFSDTKLSIPYIIMHRADEPRLKKATNFEDFKYKFTELISAIQFIHDNWIIHRDLKPENIFIYHWEIVLADFDIAKFEDINQVRLAETWKTDRLSNFHYSSPEQSDKSLWEITYKSDWYAFWQILYFLVTWVPLRGQDEINFSRYWDKYRIYEKLILKLIQQKPENRLWNQEEILDFLKEWSEEEIKSSALLSKSKIKLQEETLLKRFNDLVLKYTNSVTHWVTMFTKHNEINLILKDLSTDIDLKSNFLWYMQWWGSASDIEVVKKLNESIFNSFFTKDNIWLFTSIEINIEKIYIYKKQWLIWDSFMVIETKKQKPTKLYQWINEYEEYWIFNWATLLTRAEYDNWFKTIKWKQIDITWKSEIRIRILDKDIYFIWPRWVLLNQGRSEFDKDKFYSEFYSKYISNNRNISEDMFEIFNTHEFRRYKPWEVH